MIILVYSKTNDDNFQERLGFSEYSYYFVLKEFLPILNQLGVVIRVSAPAREVDAIYHSAVKHGQSCVFLCFAPPHLIPGIHLAISRFELLSRVNGSFSRCFSLCILHATILQLLLVLFPVVSLHVLLCLVL